MSPKRTVRFPLGQIVSTPGALDFLLVNGKENGEYLRRHAFGDWGDVPPEDARANDDALQTGARIISAYKINGDEKIWIITEADRSSTCILLPSEY